METSFVYDRPVTGKEIVGRREEVGALVRILKVGGNASIYEPAKSGKTSLVRQAFLDLNLSGEDFRSIECSLLGIRTTEDLIRRLETSITGVFAGTPAEKKVFESKYLRAELKADSPEKLKAILSAPYRIAKDLNKIVVVVLDEFEDILLLDDAQKKLKLFESVIIPSDRQAVSSSCSYVFCGSQVNAMKEIFERKKFFAGMQTRIRLVKISYNDAFNHINKIFLSGGKVIEEELVREVYDRLSGNIWYLNHFGALCNSLSRGYIAVPIVEQSLSTLIGIHEARFISTMHDLTSFQVQLLKAILDGERLLSSATVMEKYSLNSSANVIRLKDALCKKEIITIEKGEGIKILDSLFEYWLRTVYFK